jgi:hypothetical protein
LITALIDEPRSNEFIKTKPPAGLKSNKFLKSKEPPFQSKSKAVHLEEKEDNLDNRKQLNNDLKNKSCSEERTRNKSKVCVDFFCNNYMSVKLLYNLLCA